MLLLRITFVAHVISRHYFAYSSGLIFLICQNEKKTFFLVMGRLCISRDIVFVSPSLDIPPMGDMEIYWFL